MAYCVTAVPCSPGPVPHICNWTHSAPPLPLPRYVDGRVQPGPGGPASAPPLSGGQVAGIVVLSVLGAALLALLGVWGYRWAGRQGRCQGGVEVWHRQHSARCAESIPARRMCCAGHMRGRVDRRVAGQLDRGPRRPWCVLRLAGTYSCQ